VSPFEFQDFAIEGNAPDIASDGGVVVASSVIVTSLVDELRLLVASLLHGQHDASDLFVVGKPNSVAVPLFASARQADSRA
jgi:large-conductance mechanosensitive channel